MYKLLSVRPGGRQVSWKFESHNDLYLFYCHTVRNTLNYVCFILIQSHRSVNGQRQGAGLPVPTDVKLQHFKPIYKFYRQLSCTSSPVSQYDMVHFLHILR